MIMMMIDLVWFPTPRWLRARDLGGLDPRRTDRVHAASLPSLVTVMVIDC